jgi:uncharacterized sulfatase
MNLRFFIIIFTTVLAVQCREKEKAPVQTVVRERPNILIAISDDQSFPYASAYGDSTARTPTFDRVAEQGVLFTNAFVASPGCSPSRAALLTGRYPWQIEEAGTHGSSFPMKYVVFPDLLEEAGYFVGYTGKGWSPGDYEISGRKRNPAGNPYQERKLKPPYQKISNNDYTANFQDFLASRPKGQPFYFWYGASEPHREFEEGIGLKEGKRVSQATVPDFLPDEVPVRKDILDYAVEIEWFDKHLGQMIDLLDKTGELENTIIIVTSDNGMAFPRAKANVYEHGIHVPLAISWNAGIPSGRVIKDVVSLVDLTPTILEATKTPGPEKYPHSGRSLLKMLQGNNQGITDTTRVAYSGRERHSSSRWNNLTYPQRAIRTQRYLYIRNFKPERWPAGAPQKFDSAGILGPADGAYHDIDYSPSLEYLVSRKNDPGIGPYFHLAVDRRPAEELFDIQSDPACLNNLAENAEFRQVKQNLAYRLGGFLMQSGDPRVTGQEEVWESYPRLRGGIREFPVPDWAKEGEIDSLKLNIDR